MFDPGTSAVKGQEFNTTPHALAASGQFPVLAQSAGMKEPEMNAIMKKLVDVESSGGDYTAVNKSSGAFGKYQFMPETLNEYAKKTGQTVEQAKTPEGQEKMFQKYTQDNIDFLNDRDIPITALNLYGAHQQGKGGISQILQSVSKKKYLIDDEVAAGIRSNIPNSKGLDKKQLAQAWLDRWSPEFA